MPPVRCRPRWRGHHAAPADHRGPATRSEACPSSTCLPGSSSVRPRRSGFVAIRM